MISVRTSWVLLALGALALGPVAARADDDTFRLNMPGGVAADQGASTRALALMPGDQDATELVFHHCRGCCFGGCGFRCGWGGCCRWGGCLPRCYSGYYYGAPAYYYGAPVVAYSAPAYENAYADPRVTVAAPVY